MPDANYQEVSTLDNLPPGSMQKVRVGKKKILIANLDGEVVATDDTCTHDDASLSEGELDDCEVECPLHGARFDLTTGEALNPPAEEDLQRYEVEVAEGKIYIGKAIKDA